MNSNMFQTLLTTALTLCGILSSVLVSLGCKADAMGSLSCAGSNAPTWLMPWLVMIASALGIVKLVLGALTGKLTLPTAVITAASTAPGTVHPSAVNK